MRKLAPLAALLAIAGVVPAAFAAEGNRPAKRPKLSQIRLERFGSCDGLVRFGRRQSQRGPGAVPPPPSVPLALPDVLPSPGPIQGTPPPAAAPVERLAEDDSSGTTVQERGVDEPDLVKTAGARVFAIAGGELRALDVAGEPRLLDSLELSGQGHELLLHGTRLLVISHDLSAGPRAEHDGDRPQGFATYDPGVTALTEVDVSDPAALRVVRTERIAGVHVSSRLTGRTARVVVWTPAAGQLPARAARRAARLAAAPGAAQGRPRAAAAAAGGALPARSAPGHLLRRRRADRADHRPGQGPPRRRLRRHHERRPGRLRLGGQPVRGDPEMDAVTGSIGRG